MLTQKLNDKLWTVGFRIHAGFISSSLFSKMYEHRMYEYRLPVVIKHEIKNRIFNDRQWSLKIL